ncbi:MAG: glycosyltransferase [Planctomycetota bacterium]|nr:MAG: glycosyltransferase [Planctomycetota bacterium]
MPSPPLVAHAILDLDIGGAQRQLSLLAPELCDRGWQVCVITLHRGPLWQRLAESPQAQSGQLRLLQLPAYGHRDPRLILALRRILRRERPQILQTWLPLMDVVGGLASRGLGIPWVLSERNSAPEYAHGMRHRLREIIARRATKIIANSAAGTAYWQAQGIPNRRLSVITNAVDQAWIDAYAPINRAEQSIPADHLLLLFVGRLEPQKRLGDLLQAVAQACQQRPITLIICGQGSQEAQLKAQAKTLGIDPICRFLGQRDDIPAWMKTADALVLPSSHEGQANVVLEALACGCPVVLSDIPNHRQMQRDYCQGITCVPMNNVTKLTGTLCSAPVRPPQTNKIQMRGNDLRHWAQAYAAVRYDVRAVCHSIPLTHAKSPRICYGAMSNLPSPTANSVHVLHVAQACCDLGCRTHLIACRGDDVVNKQEIANKYGVRGGFHVTLLPWPAIPGWGFICGVIFGCTASWQRSDLAWTRSLPMALWSSLLGVPTVYEAHGPVPEGSCYARLLWRILQARSRFRALVVISRSLARRYIVDCIKQRRKLLVAPDAAQPNPHAVHRSRPFIQRERLRAVYVGHLHAGKGVELIVTLSNLCPRMEFHIYGGPVCRIPALTAVARRENCFFHGEIPHAEVSGILALADIALLPNKPHSWGHGETEDIGAFTSPLKLFEYLAAGVPVIASDLPVLREILCDNVNALLCPWNDADAWRKALERLYDEELRERLGKAGVNCIRECHNWQERTRKVISAVNTNIVLP